MPTLFAAYLRAYEPVSAFDRSSQDYWQRYLADGRGVGVTEGPGCQRSSVLAAMGSGWSRLPDLPEEAYVLDRGEAKLICPWNLRVRVAEAALVAREGVPQVLADAFVPASLAGAARGVVSQWRAQSRERGGERRHEFVSMWGVPLRWFVLFDEAERELELGPQRRALRYRTEISKARRRAHRALATMNRAVGQVEITEAVEEIARWLEEFHSRSVVELDYGGLVAVLSDEALSGDDSPALAAAGLAALGGGDAQAATSAYERLGERWRAVRLLERCN